MYVMTFRELTLSLRLTNKDLIVFEGLWVYFYKHSAKRLYKTPLARSDRKIIIESRKRNLLNYQRQKELINITSKKF